MVAFLPSFTCEEAEMLKLSILASRTNWNEEAGIEICDFGVFHYMGSIRCLQQWEWLEIHCARMSLLIDDNG